MHFPLTLTAEAADTGRRLDQFLVAHLAEVSRARIQQGIGEGKVLVNGAKEAKASCKLRCGDRVTLLAAVTPPPLKAVAEDIPLEVVYEDDDLAVINKPAGMMVHAGAGASDDSRNRGTLVNALLHRFGALSGVGGELRPGIVHRLDRATSGMVIVAKNETAHRKLAEQFSGRQVRKCYIALVHGWPKTDAGTVDTSISRDRIRRIRMTTRRSGGRQAVTHWRVRDRIDSAFGKFALLRVEIETGRTHQIRVHLGSLGYPVVGDTLYGAPRVIVAQPSPGDAQGCAPGHARRAVAEERESAALTRNFLHAAAIEFKHPRSGSPLAFSRPLPPELEDFLARVRAHPRMGPA